MKILEIKPDYLKNIFVDFLISETIKFQTKINKNSKMIWINKCFGR